MSAWIPVVLGGGAVLGAGVLVVQRTQWEKVRRQDYPEAPRGARWHPWAAAATGAAIGSGGLALFGERRWPYLLVAGAGGSAGLAGAVLYAGARASAKAEEVLGGAPESPARWPLALALSGAGVMWSAVGVSFYTRRRRRSNPRRRSAEAAKRELELFAARTRLAELRRELESVRTEARDTIAQSKLSCAADRDALRRARAELSERCRGERSGARARVRRSRTKLQVERQIQRAEREARRGRPARARATGAELREESDQAVERDLPPELVPVWRRVRKQIQAGPRRSRTEAFLEWVEAHPDEIAAIEAESAEREAEQMWREYHAAG